MVTSARPDSSATFHPDQPTTVPQAKVLAAGRGSVSPNHTQLPLASQSSSGVVGGRTVKDDPPIAEAQATRPPVGRPDVYIQPGPDTYYMVAILADLVEDIQKTRIANQNRYDRLVDTGDYGKAVTGPAADYVGDMVNQLAALEREATRQLKTAVQQSPLADLVANTPGLGEVSLGRLIKYIGDPAWNGAKNRPRKLRELYAYCGLHVVDGIAPKRRANVQLNWSTGAKIRLRIIAQSMVWNRNSAYRAVYDAARVKYADAVHKHACPQCGKKGQPEPAGSPLSLSHQRERAMRLVAKAVLRDVWKAAIAVYEEAQVLEIGEGM